MTIPLHLHRGADRVEYRIVNGAGEESVDRHYALLTYPGTSSAEELRSISIAGPSVTAREARADGRHAGVRRDRA